MNTQTQNNVLVTGANSGIGFATAQRFKQAGYEVYMSGRDKKKIQLAADKLNAYPICADLSDNSATDEISSIFQDSGLDVLVNNAGVAGYTPVGSYSAQDLETHFQVNVVAPLLLIQALLPALKQRKGCITNVSSVITRRGAAGFSIYAASKGAIEASTRTLALELASEDVRINAVCPGPIDTPIFSKMGFPQQGIADIHNKVISTVPMHRLGTAEEVAEVIFAQSVASYVTGSIWTVDGGVAA